MSNVIDQRILEMQFDNKQFEQGVSTSLKTLDDLKKGLNLEKSAKGLENLQKAGKKFSLEGLASNVEFVAKKFTALGVLGVTAMQRIANSAITTGKNLVSAFTIDPIKSGLKEYETQIGAIQTILSNTKSKGSTLDDVNKALDDLNAYSDRTIYNFTEMAKNIGTFTAAGVALDTSTQAIKGIANLAAVSGSNAQQASIAMYQLSQALASGTIRLMDWNSVVTAGMGGEVFQNALKETARLHGIKIDEMIKKEGTFRETLQNGWLTSSILTETLAKFTGDLTESEIIAMGYTKDQAKAIIELGKDANDAATKVKTFSQLMDTLKEALGSGWTQTWENIIGNFEEARDLWTSVSDALRAIIGQNADARNQLLASWKEAGGRDDLLKGLTDIFQALWGVVLAVGEAMREIFPDTTVENLLALSKGVRDFGNNLKLALSYKQDLIKIYSKSGTGISDALGFGSNGDDVKALQRKLTEAGFAIEQDGIFGKKTQKALEDFQKKQGLLVDGVLGAETRNALFGDKTVIEKITGSITYFSDKLDKLKSIAGGAFAIFDIGIKVFRFLWDALKEIAGLFAPIGDALLTIGADMGESLSVFDSELDKAETFTNWLKNIKAFLIPVKAWFEKAGNSLLDFYYQLKQAEGFGNVIKTIIDFIGKLFGIISTDAEPAEDILDKTLTPLEKKASKVSSAWDAISSTLMTVFGGINEFLKIIGPGGIVALIITAIGALAIYKIVSPIVNLIKGLGEIVETVQNKVFLRSEKTSTALLKMALALRVLVAIIKIIGSMSSEDLIRGVLGLTTIMALILIFKLAVNKIGGKGVKVRGLLMLAIGISILSSVVRTLGEMKLGQFIQGLSGLTVMMGLLLGFTFLLNKIGASTVKLTGLFSLAISLEILSLIVSGLGKLHPMELRQGLVGLGLLMSMLLVFSFGLNKLKISSIKLAGLLALSAGIALLVYSVKMLGEMDIKVLKQGLVGLAGLMTILLIFTKMLDKIGSSSIKLSGLFMMSVGIRILSESVKMLGEMGINALKQGLVGLASVMIMLLVFTKMLDKIGSSSIKLRGLFGLSIAIGILTISVRSLGDMDPMKLKQGLSGLTGLMAIILTFTFILNKIGGSSVQIKGLFGLSIAIGILALVIKTIGEMDSNQLKQGILGLISVMSSLLVFTAILNKIGATSIKLKGIITMSIAIGILAWSVQTLGSMPSKDALKGILSLYGVIVALIIFTKFLGKMDIKGGISSVISCIGLSIVIGALAYALGSIKIVPLSKILGFTLGLTSLMFGFAIFSAVASSIGIPGIGISLLALIGLAATIGLIIAAFAGLSKIPGYQVFMNGGMASIGEMIGSFIGSMKAAEIKSFQEGINGLGETKAPNVKGIKNAIKVAKLLGDFSASLPTKGFWSRIGDWMAGSPMKNFSADMGFFAAGFNTFSMALSDVVISKDISGKAKAAIDIANSVADLNAKLPKNNPFVQMFPWASAMSTFVEDMEIFVNGINDFAKDVQDVDVTKDVTKKTTAAIKLATSVVTFIKTLPTPPEPKWVNAVAPWVTPQTPAAIFKADMLTFIQGVNEYAKYMDQVTVDKEVQTKTDWAVKIATSVQKFLGGLPTPPEPKWINAVAPWVTPQTPAAIFKADMLTFIQGVNEYAKYMDQVTVDKEVQTKTDWAVAIAGPIQRLINGLPTPPSVEWTAAIAPWVTQQTPTYIFTEDMLAFIQGINTFAKYMDLVTVDKEVQTKTDWAIDVATPIKTFIRDLPTPPTPEGTSSALPWVSTDSPTKIFTDDMLTFIQGVNTYAKYIDQVVIKDDVPTKTAAAISIATSIRDFSNSLPKPADVSDVMDPWITGSASMLIFSVDMKTFAQAFSDYATAMGKIVAPNIEADTTVAISVADNIKRFLEGLKLADIEETRGAIQKFLYGPSKTDTILDQMGTFGQKMLLVKDGFAGLGGTSIVADVKAGTEAATAIAGFLTYIASDAVNIKPLDPTASGGMLSSFDILAIKMTELAAAIKAFDTTTADVKIDRFRTFAWGIGAIGRVLASVVATKDTESFTSFSTAMSNLVTLLSGNGKDGEKLDSSHFLDGLDSKDITSKLETFATKVTEQMGKSSATILTYTTQFDEAGQSLANNLNNGVNAAETDTSGIDTMIGELLTATNPYLSRFESVGKNFGLSMSAGLRKSAAVAVVMAQYVAAKMLEKVKEVFKINSPSKEGISIGKSLDEGLAEGVLNFASMAIRASEKTGSSMLDSTRETLSGLSAVLDGSMDGPPVIRPILDLTDVTSGAKRIGGLFSGQQTVSVGSTQSRALAASIRMPGSHPTINQNGSQTPNQVGASDGSKFDFSNSQFTFSDKLDIRSWKLELDNLERDDNRAKGSVY